VVVRDEPMDSAYVAIEPSRETVTLIRKVNS